MWKTALVCGVLSCLLDVVLADDNFIVNGTWTVYSIFRCDEPTEYPIKPEIQKRKLNRTHDGFNLSVTFPYDITEDGFSIHIELYKKCDGGYKFQQSHDDNFCGMINQFAQDNFERAMAMANVDPPNCPMPKGPFVVKDFIIDYTELPKQAVMGEYKAKFVLIKPDAMGVPEEVSCVICEAAFNPDDESE